MTFLIPSMLRAFVLSMVLLLLPQPAVLVHHSFAAEYNAQKLVTIKGTVTAFDWINPHARCHATVTDEQGRGTNWLLELAGPGVLVQNGWARDTLHVGDSITVEAALAKDDSRKASARVVTLPDGRRLFAASSADGGPQ